MGAHWGVRTARKLMIVILIIHSDHTLSTFLRIRADLSMLIFWVSVTVALSDTLLMFTTMPFFIVPSTPTTTEITSVFMCHIFRISNSRSLYSLFFYISFTVIFLSDGIDMSLSLQVEMISGLFTVMVLSLLTDMSHMKLILLSLLCVTDSGLCSTQLSITLILWSWQTFHWVFIVPGDIFCFA